MSIKALVMARNGQIGTILALSSVKGIEGHTVFYRRIVEIQIKLDLATTSIPDGLFRAPPPEYSKDLQTPCHALEAKDA